MAKLEAVSVYTVIGVESRTLLVYNRLRRKRMPSTATHKYTVEGNGSLRFRVETEGVMSVILAKETSGESWGRDRQGSDDYVPDLHRNAPERALESCGVGSYFAS